MTPIFIGGCPRSGTTLLGSMLGTHEDVVCLPESPFIGLQARAFRHSPDGVASVHRAIQGEFKFKFWQLPARDQKACLRAGVRGYRELIEAYVEAFARQMQRPNPRYWLDHTPENLAYCRRLAEAFPDAKFLHIVRDGRAVAASWMPLTWGPNTVMGAARQWMNHIAQGLAAEQALPAAQVRRIRYETLVADPDTVAQELSAWSGLPFQSAMVVGTGFQVPAYTRGQHGLIGRPADPGRIDSWRSKLRPREIEIFEHLTGDLLPNLGYELASSGIGLEPTMWEKLQFETIEKLKQLAHAASQPVRVRRATARLRLERMSRQVAQG
jgi:hypothetical protein